jgi:hypothetical protein
VTSERILRSLHHSALGVAPFSTRELTRFVTSSSAKASTLRTAIRKEALETEDSSPEPGVSASVDLTRVFVRSVDGYDCAAVFMDRSTWFIWIGPRKNYSCKEFVRVLGDYRRKVRQLFNVELRTVRADSDPCFTAIRVNEAEITPSCRPISTSCPPPSMSSSHTRQPTTRPSTRWSARRGSCTTS